MLRRRLSSAPLIASLLIATYAGAGAGERQALLELFTSQGCSSCPAADKLLGELAGDPSLVAVSVPIDYWDYLGWKDTLASPAHSARQRAYARVRDDRQVYTPQIVVNGEMQVLGSDRVAIERAIAQTNRNAATMSLPVLLSVGEGILTVKVGPGENKHLGGEVWLCPLARTVKVAVGRGENGGRTLTYYNVVRRWLKLGDFSGTGPSWTVPISEVEADGIDGAAVIVQDGVREKPGIVLGAAIAPIGPRMSEIR
ncbi:MAG TPA: DUF1223 domain-containing protein [Xanthobacteraceae bacterium]|nr:DUF1223 domain-containing protein [Xanthobacteraceae bacterium]